MVARAEHSSAITLLSARAATRDWTAELLTVRGMPRDTCWMSPSASSEKGVGAPESYRHPVAREEWG